jgi:hypothetical protein
MTRLSIVSACCHSQVTFDEATAPGVNKTNTASTWLSAWYNCLRQAKPPRISSMSRQTAMPIPSSSARRRVAAGKPSLRA